MKAGGENDWSKLLLSKGPQCMDEGEDTGVLLRSEAEGKVTGGPVKNIQQTRCWGRPRLATSRLGPESRRRLSKQSVMRTRRRIRE